MGLYKKNKTFRGAVDASNFGLYIKDLAFCYIFITHFCKIVIIGLFSFKVLVYSDKLDKARL